MLPTEMIPERGIIKIASLLRKISLAAYSVLIVIIVLMAGTYFWAEGKHKEIVASQEKLKVVIKSLQETELRLVLVKDRLAKASEVKKIKAAETKFDDLDFLSSNLAGKIVLDQADLSSSKAEITFSSYDSLSLESFLLKLSQNKDFRGVKIKSFNFVQPIGYKVTLIW